MASELTPVSISHLQNLGMMTCYAGKHDEAEKILDQTTRIGLDSKMFDCQTLPPSPPPNARAVTIRPYFNQPENLS